MKIIKPQKLSLLYRVVEAAGRLDLCVTVMIASPFDAPESLLHEVNLWKMLAAELGPDAPPDAGMPKARPEVLVIGKAYPRGEERTSCSVRLRMGAIDKTLRVETPEDRPAPAGFGPVDSTAPEHLAKAGTYDEAWQKEEAPRLPRDFDFAFYNLAPPDQQSDEPFEGGLAFALENMHPDAAVLEGRLPRLLARVFVGLQGGELREVPMRLETVQLFPEAARTLVLFRGVTAITEDDASDVRQLIAACEAPGAPRPVDHYRAVLAERLDRKRGALASLRDSDLMPEGPASRVAPGEIAGPDAVPPPEQRLRANMRRKTDADIEAARARMRAAGLDPEEHLPAAQASPPGGSPLDDVEGTITRAREEGERLKAEMAVKQAEAEAAARKQSEAARLDHDAVLAEQQQGGPPKFSAAAELERLHDIQRAAQSAGVRLPGVEAQLADPAHREKLETTERGLRDMYHRQAHQLPAAPPAGAPFTQRARQELSAAQGGGVSFAGRDFTGVDLSGLDLRGMDLRSALLEGANLAGAQLAGADLTGAVLARADLTGADLRDAKLARCNLGHAVLAGATLTGDVDLTGAVLANADLSGASFHGARLARVDFGEAFFRDTDLGGIRGEGITFLRSDLRGTKLAGASFVKCKFIEVDLRGVDLSGADLRGATLIGVDARGAVLRGARLTQLCVVKESSFEGADFTDAVLDRANLRGSKLAGCDFTRAELGGADFSDSDLRGARFDRAVGREARFIKADLTRASLVDANLMSALLGRATVRGASFLGANLFRADLSKIDTDEATRMEEANLVQARVVAARRTRGAS